MNTEHIQHQQCHNKIGIVFTLQHNVFVAPHCSFVVPLFSLPSATFLENFYHPSHCFLHSSFSPPTGADSL